MGFADIIDAALSSNPGYRQAALWPGEQQRQSLINQQLSTNLADTQRQNELKARAPGDLARAYQAAAAQPGSIDRPGAMDLNENPEAAATPAPVSPGRPAARTFQDLMSRDVAPEQLENAATYLPKAFAALNLQTPEALQQKATEEQERQTKLAGMQRSQGLLEQLDALDPNAPDHRAKMLDVLARMAAPTKPESAIHAMNQGATPGGGQAEPIAIGHGIWKFPKTNDMTGAVSWEYKFEPNFNPGQLTHEDAFASLVKSGAVPPTADRRDLGVAAQVATELTKMQAAAAGDKAARVTINTGEAKQGLPLNENAQQWLNEKGEFAKPGMTKAQAIAEGYRPYKDAVKRLDQEGASRTFMQHLQFLREYAEQLPESTGSMMSDKANAALGALKRRALGKSDPFVASMTAIDRPAALQMIRAVAPDARAGFRLQQKFEEILDPYADWTKQSYLASVDALEKMALTGMAQRGRPGMTPQPGATTVPPASVPEKSPAPTLSTGSQPGAESLKRSDPRYMKLRDRGMTDAQIQQRYGVTVAD